MPTTGLCLSQPQFLLPVAIVHSPTRVTFENELVENLRENDVGEESQNVVGESHDHEIGGYVEEDVNDQENSGDLEENINMVSTKLQSEDMRLDVAVKALEALVTFFENYREIGFASAMSDAKEIALDSEIDPVFQTKRHRPRKRHHDEVDGNEREQQSAEESFRTYYFLVIVDIALSQLKHRLNGLAILCIEKDEIEDLEYDDIIDDFASKNTRRQFLKG
ncbi:unnamed protein product [Malus baccata var. baccata]